ncbi:hypothetical protein TNCV_323431 [Trichonephila clavipes]|nr:hypothetical protein TNCV_323431 [Trichonephila clavipes]
MIPAYNKKRCAAFPFETGIHFRQKTDFFPEEDTTKSYSGVEPESILLQAEVLAVGSLVARASDSRQDGNYQGNVQVSYSEQLLRNAACLRSEESELNALITQQTLLRSLLKVQF